jgi:hypothetical protein
MRRIGDPFSLTCRTVIGKKMQRDNCQLYLVFWKGEILQTDLRFCRLCVLKYVNSVVDFLVQGRYVRSGQYFEISCLKAEHQSVLCIRTLFVPHREYDLMFVDPCIVIWNSLKEPARCDCVVEFIIPVFLKCATCFGRHTAHHQELKNCNYSLWFNRRFWLPVAVAMAEPYTVASCWFILWVFFREYDMEIFLNTGKHSARLRELVIK